MERRVNTQMYAHISQHTFAENLKTPELAYAHCFTDLIPGEVPHTREVPEVQGLRNRLLRLLRSS